jgi:hypothetical protein
MIRAFGVALGIAKTRPIVGVFFATRRFSPQEFLERRSGWDSRLPSWQRKRGFITRDRNSNRTSNCPPQTKNEEEKLW